MNKLSVQLGGAFALVTALTVALIMVMVNRAVDSSFNTYIGRANNLEENADLLQQLETYYDQNRTWVGAETALDTTGHGQRRGEGATLLVADADFRVTAATDAAWMGQSLSELQQQAATALQVNGQTVGYFVRESPGQERLLQIQQDFRDDITQTLAVIGISAAGVALLLGLLLAWWFARPLLRLKQAAQALANGAIGISAPLLGTAEVRQVAQAFNHMSAALAENTALRQRMTSDIAHELRTPISVMRTQLEGMLDEMVAVDVQQVGIVYNQTLHLARLVEDLRTLTRAEAHSLPLEKTDLEVNTLVQQIFQDFEPLALDAEIHLSLEPAVESLMVKGDGGRIRQVLSNLLVNALHHTPAGGRVSLSVSWQKNQVAIAIQDTGAGLTEEQAKHIFERFYRTDEARQRDQGGSGLGLAISRELVRLHGGEITVQSQVGLGSTFTVLLPKIT